MYNQSDLRSTITIHQRSLRSDLYHPSENFIRSWVRTLEKNGYQGIFPHIIGLHAIDLDHPFNDDEKPQLEVVQNPKEIVQSLKETIQNIIPTTPNYTLSE